MRQSATNRASTALGSSSSGAAAAQYARLLEKKKEHDAVMALERATALYVARLQALQEDCKVMSDTGAVFGQVLAQWPRMFQILQQFIAMRESETGNDDVAQPEHGQRLVRIPIEELATSSS